MSKSHVAMGTAICPVCGKTEEDGTVLLARRVVGGKLDTPFKEGKLHVQGYGLCKEHRAQTEAGYVHLVAVDLNKSQQPLAPSTAWRTGPTAALRREVAARIFNVDVSKHEFVYVEPEVIDMLAKQAAQGEGDGEQGPVGMDSGDAGDAGAGSTG